MSNARNLLAFLSCLLIAGCTVVSDVNGLGSGGGGADAAPGTPDAAVEGDGAVTPTPQSVLNEFGLCASLADDWDANGMNLIAATISSNGQPCTDCHSAGQGAAYLGLDNAQNFEMGRTFPYIQTYVVTDADLLPIVSDRLLSASQGLNAHPVTFTLPAEVNLQGFYDAVNAKYIAGNCIP